MALASVSCVFKTFIGGSVTFIGERGLVIGGLFKAARVGVDDIKRVDKRNLRQWLMVYKLKGLLVLINSLISVSDYSIWLSLWAMLYSTCGTDLLFLL
jgi:hypothetical protein